MEKNNGTAVLEIEADVALQCVPWVLPPILLYLYNYPLPAKYTWKRALQSKSPLPGHRATLQ